MGYDNLRLEKGMYRQSGKSFTQVLESLDPSENYRGTALENTDAFQRQLKRFGIRAKGVDSSPVEDAPNNEKVRVHEYGHCIQSLLLGPLYLIVVGIVSYTWANLPYFRKLRKEKGIPYTACFVESWASKWGELVTGEEAVWH